VSEGLKSRLRRVENLLQAELTRSVDAREAIDAVFALLRDATVAVFPAGPARDHALEFMKDIHPDPIMNKRVCWVDGPLYSARWALLQYLGPDARDRVVAWIVANRAGDPATTLLDEVAGPLVSPVTS
jgi:hypothetical protein